MKDPARLAGDSVIIKQKANTKLKLLPAQAGILYAFHSLPAGYNAAKGVSCM